MATKVISQPTITKIYISSDEIEAIISQYFNLKDAEFELAITSTGVFDSMTITARAENELQRSTIDIHSQECS